MKTNYFTKVENKYVFNVSLIFWHVFIALSSLTVAICLLVFLWSVVPASQKKVTKQPIPEKTAYPTAVKVSLNDLNLNKVNKDEVPILKQEEFETPQSYDKKPVEDLTGFYEFQKYMDTIEMLIPPEKYSWKGSGYYEYPNGKRYWDYYKQEKYRRWRTTEQGLEDKLNISFNKVSAKTYTNKKQLLTGYISILKLLPEAKRIEALQFLLKNITDNISQNLNIYNSLVGIIKKMDNLNDITYINVLSSFGKYNPNDGIPLINYISSIIVKFDSSQQSTLIGNIANSYYQFFNQNLSKQIDATNLYLPLASQLKPEQQAETIYQYYRLFLEKNRQRDREIDKIENEHRQAIARIEDNFLNDQLNSQIAFESKKAVKVNFRNKSLIGIGGGILLIVFIATFLAFLSIQRSVRKMEEKMDK